MDRFRYVLAASVLHDSPAVEGIFSRYGPLLESTGGTRVSEEEAVRADAPEPLAVFVLTGGTEGKVLDILGRLPPGSRGRPVLLIAHPQHNSLPAALEILARARQDGESGTIALLAGPDDDRGAQKLGSAVRAAAAAARMASLRIGAVGEPSDWLVASSQSAETVAASWGPTLVPVTIEDLRKRMEAVRSGGQPLDERALGFWDGADSRAGPSESDLRKSFAVYRALKEIVSERRLDALTLRCFDLVTLDSSTGCYALSRLADEGIDSGCEGDIPSILALAWMRALTGEPAWMANPSFIDAQKGEMLLAHCTVPLKGLSGYGIRTHFESGLGVAVAGTFPPGPVTLIRIGGADLREIWTAEAEITQSPRREGLCRTQIVARVQPEKLRELLNAPLGNHLVIARGAWSGPAEGYLELTGIRKKTPEGVRA